jgi:hypothetical protein
MSATKEQLQKLIRPLVVKWATRGVLWIATAVLGLTATAAESEAAQLGAGAGAAACLLVSYLIDRWHDRTDKAETPQAP